MKIVSALVLITMLSMALVPTALGDMNDREKSIMNARWNETVRMNAEQAKINEAQNASINSKLAAISPAIYSSPNEAGVYVIGSHDVDLNVIASPDNKQPVKVQDSSNVSGNVKFGENSSSIFMHNGDSDKVNPTASISMHNGQDDTISSDLPISDSFTADPLTASTLSYNLTAANSLNEDMVVEGNNMNRWEYNELMHNQGVENLPLWSSYVAIRSYENQTGISVLDGPLTLVPA